MLQPLVIRAVVHVPGTHHPDSSLAAVAAAADVKCPLPVEEGEGNNSSTEAVSDLD